jgi:hypothetical protein
VHSQANTNFIVFGLIQFGEDLHIFMTVLLVKETRVVSSQRKPVTSSSQTRVVSSQRKPVTSSSQISSQKVVFSTPHHGQESMRIKAIIYSTLTITPEVSGCQVTVILLLPLHQRPVGVK